MHHQNETEYPIVFQQLIDSAPLCALGPGRENVSALGQLSELSLESFGVTITDRDMANCCISGLWLKHDFLDRSHTISQDIDTAEGSFWHGIMHRREPDYSNAKYWYRRVGDHAIFQPLAKQLLADDTLSETVSNSGLISNSRSDPYAFVDACQQAAKSGNGQETRKLQEGADLEWKALFEFCYRCATERYAS